MSKPVVCGRCGGGSHGEQAVLVKLPRTANMAASPASRETREQSPDWPPLSEEPIGSEMFNPAEIEPRARWLKISSGGCVSLNCS